MTDIVEQDEVMETVEAEPKVKTPKDPGVSVVTDSGEVRVSLGEKTVTLEPGTYRKVNNRIGTAFLTVSADATLSYTNRRNETELVTPREFLRIFNTGLNTLHDGTKPEKPAKVKTVEETTETAEEVSTEELLASI